MTELIFKTKVDKTKMDTLLQILKSWDIEVELKKTVQKPIKKRAGFTLATGIWKDYDTTAPLLRTQAWNRTK